MDEAIFVDLDGHLVPARITRAYILRWYAMSFPDLLDDEYAHIVEEAIDAVYVMFYGCNFLFMGHTKQTFYNKTIKLFGWLTCWYIADQYPLMVHGQPTMGALPLKSKKIGPITLAFQDNFVRGQNSEYLNLLNGLRSNSWGKLAYMAITGAGQRATMFTTTTGGM